MKRKRPRPAVGLLEHADPFLAPALAKIAAATLASPLTIDDIAQEGQAFALALIARHVHTSQGKSSHTRTRRVWAVAANTRAQEILHNDLLNWIPESHFLPELEMAAVEDALTDPEITAERLAVLHAVHRDSAGAPILLTEAALDEMAPTSASFDSATFPVRKADTVDLESLAARLSAAGYERSPQAASRGEFAVRGGILDAYSWHHALPVRIELFGDTVESIREYDPDTQTSLREIGQCDLLAGTSAESGTARLRDQIPPDDLVVAVDLPGLPSHIHLSSEPGEGSDDEESLAFLPAEIGAFGAGDFIVEEAKRRRFLNQLRAWRADGWLVAVYCNNDGETDRLRVLLQDNGIDPSTLQFPLGSIHRGFTFPAAKLAVLCDSEIFGRYRAPSARRLAARRATRAQHRSQIDFSELAEGDLVVHLEQGIAKFRGLRSIPAANDSAQEVLELEFANESKLFVPLEHSYLVSRYVGVGKRLPDLSSLGDGRWQKARRTAEKAVFDYAASLLAVHAERLTAEGHAFPPDTRWQQEFESAFIYTETPDQLRAIEDTKRDMELVRPMDRLICGDVGFGKTEVAIRAAFKSVMGGRQVAFLVPTTVLANQHYHTLRERMSDYPVRVEMLSRFKTHAEQREVLDALADGSADIVVGTHRLISKDVRFKQLGLVVVDEEQRFGVAHKEKLKDLFRRVDVLTLSATPIPRTLYLSLMGARDLSTIETAPPNRLPVETVICAYDERVIREAIRRELERKGQVYFLHNRVRDIEHIRDRIRHLVPKARVEIGHGQMDADELEQVMGRFVEGEADVLVSTTIIESGLDIPNANTIIIHRADRFGLADLYQLRGRVGRAQHKAYAYLMLPREMMGSADARRRIRAIKEHSSLGAGFRIAMRDLEIRGAGNILGTAQSGHATAIGFDLYCQLLRQAVSKLKGETVNRRADVPVDLDFAVTVESAWFQEADPAKLPAFIPTSYVADSPTRIHAYRDVATATTPADLQTVRAAFRDRFGPIPDAVENLFALAEIRVAAAAKDFSRVEVRGERIMLTRKGEFVQVKGRFPRLTPQSPKLSLRQILDQIRVF